MDRLIAPRLTAPIPLAVAAVLLTAGCVADVRTSGSPDPADTGASVAPPASAARSASPAASSAGPSGIPSASEPTPAGDEVLAAVEALTRLQGARVTMAVDRWKGEVGPERLVSAQGDLMPLDERGRVVYDLSSLFAVPGASASPLDRIDLAWNRTTMWVWPADGMTDWEEATRAHARENGGIIGRLPDELLGLARAVAAADPADVTGLPPDGEATRYLVPVPVELAVGHGVPSDTPHADVVRDAYGIDEIPVEVWLRDGEVVRLRYSFERERAPHGGPDRTQTTYDWVADPAIRIALPPGR